VIRCLAILLALLVLPAHAADPVVLKDGTPQTFTIPNFRLENGAVLPQARVEYATCSPNAMGSIMFAPSSASRWAASRRSSGR